MGSNLSVRHTNGSTVCCGSNAKAVAFINLGTQIINTQILLRQNIGEVRPRDGFTTGSLVEKTRGSPSECNILIQSRDGASDSLVLREKLDDGRSPVRVFI